jgi:HEPN domain-containing protein
MSEKVAVYKHWINKGARDIEAAQFLFDNHHYTDIIALHIQQALEKHMKGLLLKQGWPLKKTHDLVTLAAEVYRYGLDLREYEDNLDRINEYYIESRYPLGQVSDYPHKEIETSLSIAWEIINKIAETLHGRQ